MAMKRVHVAPKFDHLAFSMLVPEDFRQLPMPEGVPDFSNPTEMMPLGVFMAGYGAVLASVAARPLKADGSEGGVMEIAMQLASHQLASAGGQVRKLMPARKWGTQVVEVEAVQPSEAGEMTVRAVFLEDGGTLYNVAMMAPTALWGSVETTLTQMVDSFALAAVKGPTRGIAPGQAPPAKAAFVVEGPAATTEAVAASASQATPPAASAPPATGAPVQNAGPDLSPFALDDAQALDPEDNINARFRDAGAGLVPNVVTQLAGGPVVGLGALEAAMPVPAGWHVVDDGRRALVFDRGNMVQVSMVLLPMNDRVPRDFFNEVLEDLIKASPGLEHREFEAEGFNVMHVRKLVIDGEPLQQAYLLRRHPTRENLVLKVRITAGEENLVRAMDMTAIMVNGTQFMS